MYICYFDESGFSGSAFDPEQPVCVVAGVLANDYNMSKSVREFEQLIATIRDEQDLAPLPDPRELKGKALYRGDEDWDGVDGATRHLVYAGIIDWLTKRTHRVLYSAIDSEKFLEERDGDNEFATVFSSPYVAAAYQACLTVERRHKGKKKNKGKTLFIFDEQDDGGRHLQDLCADPLEWTCDYCNTKAEDPITQMVDTPLFARSHMSPFIQIADLMAYVLRRYLMLKDFNDDERWDGELTQAEDWVSLLQSRLINACHMYPSNSSGITDFYREVTPRHALELAGAAGLS